MRKAFLLLPLFLILGTLAAWEWQGHKAYREAVQMKRAPCADARDLVLKDGRHLTYREVGDPAGQPVFFFHDALGSRLDWPVGEDAVRATGVHLVSVDRPGYGCSDPQPGRTLAGWADDVRQLAGALKWERFRVVGWAAGGVHALATARFLPDRVMRVDTVGLPTLPSAAVGSQLRLYAFLRGNFPGNVFRLFEGLRTEWHTDPAAFEDEISKSYSGPDREAAAVPAIREQIKLSHTQALKDSIAGLFDDARVTSPPWPFAPSDIKVPVRLWHGSADTLAAFDNSRILSEAIPGSVLKRIPDEGHFLIYKHEREILAP